MIIGIIAYFLFALGIAFWGKERTIGFFNSLVISLLLTPIAGFFVVLNSQKLILYHIVQHNCPECGYSFSEPHDYCPMCAKEGKYIILKPNIVPTT
jgi:hypothetical protein